MAASASTFLDEGSHGCVLRPPLPCRRMKKSASASAKAKTKTSAVGKIIKAKDAIQELSTAALITSIPGWQRYFIIQEKADCDSKNFSALRDQYEKQCKVYGKSYDSELVQLVSPYAGSTLHRIQLTESFDYMSSFRHVLEGISKLASQGICHFDLHESNILIDLHETMRIIDFGAAFLGDHIDEKGVRRHMYAFSPSFPPQPPELSMQNGINQGMTLLESLEGTMFAKKEFALGQQLLGLSIKEQESELGKFWIEDTEWNGTTWVPFFHKYWKTWDSWAVGVLFLNLLKKSFLFPGFIEKTWKEHGVVIRKVLKGCLASNPMKRFTADEALRVLREG